MFTLGFEKLALSPRLLRRAATKAEGLHHLHAGLMGDTGVRLEHARMAYKKGAQAKGFRIGLARRALKKGLK